MDIFVENKNFEVTFDDFQFKTVFIRRQISLHIHIHFSFRSLKWGHLPASDSGRPDQSTGNVYFITFKEWNKPACSGLFSHSPEGMMRLWLGQRSHPRLRAHCQGWMVWQMVEGNWIPGWLTSFPPLGGKMNYYLFCHCDLCYFFK